MDNISARLRMARAAAGYTSASEAVDRFGWNYATYSGHENGNRGVRLEVLQRYAAAFKVSTSWLLEGQVPDAPPKTPISVDVPQSTPGGLFEPPMSLYVPPSGVAGKVISNAVAALAPGWRHLETWISGRHWYAYAILKGDIVVIGTPPTVRDGDLVVATWPDPDSITLLGQRTGDMVILPPGETQFTAEPFIAGAVAVVLRQTHNEP